jgi:hypothetical protein
MSRWPTICLLLVCVVFALGCGGARTDTEKTMFDWANALNLHLTGSADGSYTYPTSLDEIDPMLRTGLSETDGWGNAFHYRRLDEDRYQLISAGPNGTFGDDDDVIVEKGLLKKPQDIYAEQPFKA